MYYKNLTLETTKIDLKLQKILSSERAKLYAIAQELWLLDNDGSASPMSPVFTGKGYCRDLTLALGYKLAKQGYSVELYYHNGVALDLVPDHYFLTVKSADQTIVIDPAYKQFFTGPLAHQRDFVRVGQKGLWSEHCDLIKALPDILAIPQDQLQEVLEPYRLATHKLQNAIGCLEERVETEAAFYSLWRQAGPPLQYNVTNYLLEQIDLVDSVNNPEKLVGLNKHEMALVALMRRFR